jgi:hypothetical protein
LEPEDQQRFQNWQTATHSFPDVKKPWLAGAMSAVIPGAGQVYNGNYQSAVFSFLINALFLSASIELSRQGLPATSAVSGTIFSIVYVGNILGSMQSSQLLNEKAHQNKRSELRQHYFPELYERQFGE